MHTIKCTHTKKERGKQFECSFISRVKNHTRIWIVYKMHAYTQYRSQQTVEFRPFLAEIPKNFTPFSNTNEHHFGDFMRKFICMPKTEHKNWIETEHKNATNIRLVSLQKWSQIWPSNCPRAKKKREFYGFLHPLNQTAFIALHSVNYSLPCACIKNEWNSFRYEMAAALRSMTHKCMKWHERARKKKHCDVRITQISFDLLEFRAFCR